LGDAFLHVSVVERTGHGSIPSRSPARSSGTTP
jgi:hypothetical protein